MLLISHRIHRLVGTYNLHFFEALLKIAIQENELNGNIAFRDLGILGSWDQRDLGLFR